MIGSRSLSTFSRNMSHKKPTLLKNLLLSLYSHHTSSCPRENLPVLQNLGVQKSLSDQKVQSRALVYCTISKFYKPCRMLILTLLISDVSSLSRELVCLGPNHRGDPKKLLHELLYNCSNFVVHCCFQVYRLGSNVTKIIFCQMLCRQIELHLAVSIIVFKHL